MRAWRALGLIGLVAVGCGEVHKIARLHFNVSKSLGAQSIPGSITPCSITSNLPLDFLQNPFSITMSQSTDFPQQNTDVQHIVSAHLTQMHLALASTSAQQNWDFLDGLTFSAQASGLPTSVAASIGANTESATPIPQGSTTLDLKPTGLDLAPYLKASGGFTITSQATGCPPSQNATFDGSAAFSIVADPL